MGRALFSSARPIENPAAGFLLLGSYLQTQVGAAALALLRHCAR
jgi:hypothetical protein